jgi:hypothetical protein
MYASAGEISLSVHHVSLKEFIEVITTDLSLSPFDSDELSRILDLIDRFEGKRSVCL